MQKMTTYEIQTTVATLKAAHDDGVLPADISAPLRSMVSDLGSRADAKSLSIYICSTDENAPIRNYFAHVLAMAVKRRVSATYLVDCDFLDTGLSGIVPHRDALGFLDLLLYGTSLSVITQQASAGIAVIGAGSFPVTKKSPFAMDTFDNTHRYLANHAGCLIYCGPVVDDGDAVHPIADHVDLVVVVNASDTGGFRAGSLDAIETAVASAKGANAWSVRINTRPSAGRADELPATARPDQEQRPTLPADEATFTMVAETDVDVTVGKSAEQVVEPGDGVGPAPRERAPAAGGPTPPADRERPASGGAGDKRAAGQEPGMPIKEDRAGMPAASAAGAPKATTLPRAVFDRKPRGSRWLRVVTPVVAIFLVAFVVWWLYLTKSVREREQQLDTMAGSKPAVERPTQPADSTQAPGTSATAPAGSTGTAEQATQEVATEQPPAKQPELNTTDGVPLAERLDDFANQYLVHVSSFRRLDRARDEALYLMGRDYPVFLYRIDLGGKGIWYRVYVGPAETRDEARAYKIKLDEDPRIQSTRIARVPG